MRRKNKKKQKNKAKQKQNKQTTTTTTTTTKNYEILLLYSSKAALNCLRPLMTLIFSGKLLKCMAPWN